MRFFDMFPSIITFLHLLLFVNGLVTDDLLGPLVSQFTRQAPPAGYDFLHSISTSNDKDTLLNTNHLSDTQNAFSLRIALASNDLPGLEQAVQQISTPGNPRYRNYLTENELAEYIRPSQKTKNALTTWLTTHNLTAKPITPAGDWVEITNLPILKANNLLNADYTTFVHTSTGNTALRTLSYSIPSGLQEHVETIYPGSSFDFGLKEIVQSVPIRSSRLTKRRRDLEGTPTKRAQPPASCATLMTPSCLQQLYSIPSTPAKQRSNTITVTGYNNQFAQKADLQNFLQILRPDISPNTTFKLQTLNNGSNIQASAQAGTEANLDIQLVTGVATSVPVTFLSVGITNTYDGLGAFIDTANFVLGQGRARPSVLTTSYGFNEVDLDPSNMRKLCSSYMQLGALGTSVIFSSGDGGVSGNSFTDCTDHGRFVPSFPSSCPYVTSVGGSTADGTAFPRETALFFSSGGFSDVFKKPGYQVAQVASYLQVLGSNYTGLFNPNGRAFPDVAAFGSDVPIINGGQRVRVGGTSTSAPIFASIIALINDRLSEQGKKPLGFLNPWLYSQTTKDDQGLRDVVSGSNPGCNTTGFAAAAGWDPVTGLGTPNFVGLLRAAGISA